MTLAGKIFSKTKRVATEQLAVSFLGGITAKRFRGNYILMYHGVTTHGSTRFNSRHVSVDCFRKQLGYLKKYCAVISVYDFFEKKFVPGKSNFALTFDDGYLNNFTYAKPILEEFKCPATFYITGLNEVNDNILWADYVNIASTLTGADMDIEGEMFSKKGNVYFSQQSGKSLYEVIKHQKAGYPYKQLVKQAFSSHVSFESDSAIKEYWQLMSDEQIKQAAQSPYITIGSHAYYHNNLGTIAMSEALSELNASKNYLENLTQYPVTQLAYPDGSYTPAMVRSATQLGFSVQLAADRFLFNEQQDNTVIKKRNGIYTTDSCINQLFSAVANP